jgi:hypothetical protein
MARPIDPLIVKFEQTMATLASANEVDVMAAAYASPVVHFALFCSIYDKDNNLIHCPEPNILQLRMSEAFETLKLLGLRVRIIVTKPRRAGCSSFVEHIGYHTAMRTQINGMTIADDKAGSEAAMKKLASYAVHDRFDWGVRIVANPTHSISWSNGSTWIVDTAENADAGAGDTLHFFHGTEVSKWPKTTAKNDAKVMSCVTPALSGETTTMFSESTPEGAVGWQFNTWQEAVWLDDLLAMIARGIRPEKQWVKVFAAWFEFADNRRQTPVSPEEIEQIKETLTDHEAKEIELYDLSWEQIAWRRDTIKNDCDGDPKIFSYYYPSDDVSCWLASGSPRFDMEAVLLMERAAKMEAPSTGYLLTQDNKRVIFQSQRDGTGDILVWEMPKPGLSYLVALDPATNESQTVSKDPDRHSLSVWRRGYHDAVSDRWKPAKRVARLRPPFRGEDEDVAGHTVRLSKFYGNAMVAQEINVGQGIMRLLQIAGVPLYKRKVWSPRVGSNVEQYGFKMSSEKDVREALISGLASAIRNGDIDPSCPHAVGEYKTFIRNANGKSEAGAGSHDDDVLGDSIAWECLPSASPYQMEIAKHVDPPDRGAQGWRAAKDRW